MSNTPSKNILDEQDVADAASSVSNTENYTIHSDNESVDDDFEGPDAASVYKSVSQSETGQKKKQSWREILTLSFSSLGAIYGDLGTSPLYVLNSIKYKESPPSQKDIYGGISLIFYLFTIIVLFKYVCVVLFIGPNNGEGGQVAIYAKIARYLKIGPRAVHIPGAPEISDLELITRQDTTSSFMSSNSTKSRINKIKNSPVITMIMQGFILCACFLGCSLVFSDGLLTPTTSVLSAVGGIQIAKPDFNAVLAVSEVILIALFVVQQFGSHKISFTFAPIVFIWLIGLIICGLYNIIKYHPGVFKALSPYYAIELLKSGGIDCLGGAMLAITGTEAMFADIGHFGRLPIQLTLACFVYPALMICYLGQGAYIVTHPEAIVNPFYLSLPGGTGSGPYWIMFVLAILATIIASQALILSVFSIISQLINLDCFPNLKIVHVSKHYVGKVYIPTANWILMIGVIATTAGFKNSNNVTAAYGLGITLDFLVTSSLIIICLFYVYNVNIIWCVLFLVIFVPLEICMVIANIKKIVHGAWFPIMMAGISFIFLSIWRWARSRMVNQEIRTRIKIENIYPKYKKTPVVMNLNSGVAFKDEIEDEEAEMSVDSKFGRTPLVRHDGIAIMYNESTLQSSFNSPNSVPALYGKIVRSFSSIPSVFIFCSIRVLSIPVVPSQERVLIASTKIPGHYKCILRYGFTEQLVIDKELNTQIIYSIPNIYDLLQKYNGMDKSILIKPDNIPILHIFEHNLVRCHDYSYDELKTNNPFVIIKRVVRRALIDHFFGPISSITQPRGQFVKLKNEEEEVNNKIFIGSVARI
ncbi:high affinity potassium transporter [Scheffersomyces stipitis CBS 6054]|uniref:High affinity potassium transporter n=1 Tax=Scheffersomyces stipitis (strain ATCC 58785 / CBS 6054 / NBRC 10063 / NRRL Y-11545) TaxID=322104 RepID=A3LQK9_PICST|nr:high affinity potassium transporter [Scheffersomyces stipitis CBS 6054]ABN65222.2 high affinity potassium transporter [Scheffersomyces stipitis CBS 6054]